MPWKETCAMGPKIQMIGGWLSREYHIAELSGMYGVSRRTIYKWIGRAVAWLRNQYPDKKWPAYSTANEILKKNGLVKSRRGRRRGWFPDKELCHLLGLLRRWPLSLCSGLRLTLANT